MKTTERGGPSGYDGGKKVNGRKRHIAVDVEGVPISMRNEGHAKTLVKLGIIDPWRLRPIIVFVGNSELKTAGKFLPFNEYEKIA